MHNNHCLINCELISKICINCSKLITLFFGKYQELWQLCLGIHVTSKSENKYNWLFRWNSNHTPFEQGLSFIKCSQTSNNGFRSENIFHYRINCLWNHFLDLFEKIPFFHFLRAKFGQKTCFSSIYDTITIYGNWCGDSRLIILSRYFD